MKVIFRDIRLLLNSTVKVITSVIIYTSICVSSFWSGNLVLFLSLNIIHLLLGAIVILRSRRLKPYAIYCLLAELSFMNVVGWTATLCVGIAITVHPNLIPKWTVPFASSDMSQWSGFNAFILFCLFGIPSSIVSLIIYLRINSAFNGESPF